MDTEIFLFVIASALLVLTSFGVVSIFGFSYWVEQVIFFLIAGISNIILAAFILSFLNSITPSGFLTIHIIFLLIVFLIIKSIGKKFFPHFAQIDLNEFIEFKSHLPILILASGILIFLLVSIFQILYVPANNWDSMTYHLSRIGFWLQNGSIDFFQTYNFRQNSLPPNAEILIMWTIAFIKSDILAGFVQWIGYLGTLLLVYGIALELGSTRFQSIFASLVWASIPEVMLEATSTQNDLVVAFFLMASIFFMLRSSGGLERKGFWVSGISIGLAVGTKGTSVFALPGIFIAALFLFYKRGNNFRMNLATWFASAFIGIIIFGSYTYINNYLYYGYPFGPKAAGATLTNPNLANMLSNLYHIFYRFLDTSGIPFFEIPVFFNARYFHEDYAGYGLVWFFLGVPALFYALYKGFFKNDFLKMWLFIIAVGYLLSFSFALTINPHIFRLLIFFTAIICPLVAFFYPQESTLFYPKKYNKLNWHRAFFTSITTVGIIPIFVSTFFNISKPFYLPFADKKSIFEMDFYEKRFFFPSKKDEMIIFKELDKMAKTGSRIGIIASSDDWDYPAFGKRFERKVFPILLNKLNTDKDIFTQYNLDYLIVSGQIQNIESVKIDVMPFITQLKKSDLLHTLRVGNMFLFAKKSAL